MPINVPESLVAYAEKHIGKGDDLGMIQKLTEAFDDLSLGATPASLGDLIAVAAVFIALQGSEVEETINSRLERMRAQLEKSNLLIPLGPVTIPAFLPVSELAEPPIAEG